MPKTVKVEEISSARLVVVGTAQRAVPGGKAAGIAHRNASLTTFVAPALRARTAQRAVPTGFGSVNFGLSAHGASDNSRLWTFQKENPCHTTFLCGLTRSRKFILSPSTAENDLGINLPCLRSRCACLKLSAIGRKTFCGGRTFFC